MQISKSVLAVVLLFSLVLVPSVYAESDFTDTAAMMGLGMGARALGMGGAHIAVKNHAAVIYYNPAGLATVDGFQATSLYTSQYGSAGYLALGAAGRNMGGALLRLSSSGIEERDEYGNVIGTFGVGETALIGGYGRRIVPGLSLGASVKYYMQNLPDNEGSGITADLGLLYEVVEDKVAFGIVGRNVVGNVTYSSGTKDAFDRVFGFGGSFVPIDNLLVAVDAVIHEGFSGRLGLEYTFHQVAIRAGGSFGSESFLTVGAGFAVENFSVDYAYQHHNLLPDSHKMSFSIKF